MQEAHSFLLSFMGPTPPLPTSAKTASWIIAGGGGGGGGGGKGGFLLYDSKKTCEFSLYLLQDSRTVYCIRQVRSLVALTLQTVNYDETRRVM